MPWSLGLVSKSGFFAVSPFIYIKKLTCWFLQWRSIGPSQFYVLFHADCEFFSPTQGRSLVEYRLCQKTKYYIPVGYSL
jgi:hypothetical protein